MQIISISLQANNHASTSSLNFFTGRMLWSPIGSVKALKANVTHLNNWIQTVTFPQDDDGAGGCC